MRSRRHALSSRARGRGSVTVGSQGWRGRSSRGQIGHGSAKRRKGSKHWRNLVLRIVGLKAIPHLRQRRKHVGTDRVEQNCFCLLVGQVERHATANHREELGNTCLRIRQQGLHLVGLGKVHVLQGGRVFRERLGRPLQERDNCRQRLLIRSNDEVLARRLELSLEIALTVHLVLPNGWHPSRHQVHKGVVVAREDVARVRQKVAKGSRSRTKVQVDLLDRELRVEGANLLAKHQKVLDEEQVPVDARALRDGCARVLERERTVGDRLLGQLLKGLLLHAAINPDQALQRVIQGLVASSQNATPPPPRSLQLRENFRVTEVRLARSELGDMISNILAGAEDQSLLHVAEDVHQHNLQCRAGFTQHLGVAFDDVALDRPHGFA
mmetsp:Transcript_26727/g.85061  ORF Transcript_26727/g.85061 Transcript_26727/m.85061 type:complete len:382 (+) Transcript_26727:256-1401(+)